MRLVALDTETTGLNFKGDICKGHRIIEIACIEIVDGRVTGRQFHHLINPGMPICKNASKIHGITDDEVKDKPTFKRIVKKLLDFIGSSTIIIHNAPFDIAFLDQEFNLLSKKDRPNRIFNYIDTLPMTRNRFPGEDNTLDALARRFGLLTDGKQRVHGALTDAKLLAEIYLLLN